MNKEDHYRLYKSIIKKVTLLQVLFSTLLTGMASASGPHTQDQLSRTISIRAYDTELRTVLKQIGHAADLRFSYDAGAIGAARRVDIAVTDEKVSLVLDRLLTPLNIRYSLLDGRVVLRPAPIPPGPPQNEVEERREKKISGQVRDESGNELPGVNIQVKGTMRGTTTDSEGKYILDIADGDEWLVFSFVGYEAREIAIGSKSVIDLTLVPQLSQLDELVVIGYGTQKKSDLTGSVASVSEIALKQPVSSFDRALQGTVAGVQVTQSSGQPGSSLAIRVRGGNSINGGNEPLYVIDGFPVYNNNSDVNSGVTAGPGINALASLNPSDIESIDVLKDASATAIYGSRGANGVVIITTKKGKSGQNNLTYDAYYGTQQVIRTIPVLTSAYEWGKLKNEARVNAGKTPYYSDERLNGLTGGTDWQDAAFRSAPLQNHQVSLSGGDDKTRYAISGNYFKQEGVLRNTGFDRYSIRLNLDRDFSDRLKIGTNFTTSRVKSRVANYSIIRALLLMPPTVSVYDDEGNYTYQSEFETPLGNPVATLEKEINNTTTYRVLGNVFAEYRLAEGLTAKVSLGADIANNKQNRYIPSDIYQGANSNPTGKAYVGSKFVVNWLNENTLSYTRNFGGNHSFNAVAGFTQQGYSNETAVAGSQAFITDLLTYNDLGSGSIYTQPESGAAQWALTSYLARVNYSYNRKYFLTVSGRADGSSRFGKDNKWGYFPSAAVAWNVTRENFFPVTPVISNLKVRLSAGITGNQEIGQYQSLATLNSSTYFFSDQIYIGFAPNRIANPDLGWETTAQYDGGIDLSLFHNRLNVVFDVYYKKTTDLLLNVPLPYTTGQSSSLQNYGSVQNKGVELSLNSDILDRGNFLWNSQLVFSANRNKVLSLGDDAGYIISGASIVKVGEPLGSFYGYLTNGLFQTGDDIASLPTINPANTFPGDRRYVDLNGDGKITQADDRAVIGSAQPRFLGGFTNNFSYHNIDLSIFFQGSYGNRIFNVNRQELESLSGQQNASVTALDRWTPENPSNLIHRPYEDPSTVNTDRYVEDASFLRLKNVTLGYNLPKKLTSRMKLDRVRVYISAQNFLTWTDYSGYDPEVSRNEQSTISQGIDNSVYPVSKSYQAGLSVSF